MQLGKLTFEPVRNALALVADQTRKSIEDNDLHDSVWVSKIDADLADTAAFCEHYGIGMDVSANCVIVEAKRADKVWYAACLVLATTRADVNGTVRRDLDARKISFAPMDTATSLSQMEYGGITPIGLPSDWPILVDAKVMEHDKVIIGSGIRGSKIYVTTEALKSLPNAKVMEITKG